jgi:hypothetical protein
VPRRKTATLSLMLLSITAGAGLSAGKAATNDQSIAPGAKVIQRPDNGGANQHWVLVAG